jgi:hypothetical protein
LKKIGVVSQYKAQCLIRHLASGWVKFNQKTQNLPLLLWFCAFYSNHAIFLISIVLSVGALPPDSP